MKKTILILCLTFFSIITYAQPSAFQGLDESSNSTAFIFGNMQIFGASSVTGDWIAAFDEQDNLVGTTEINSGFFVMTLYGSTNQLIAGEMFKLRGWDASTNTYYQKEDPEEEFGPWSPQSGGGGWLPGFDPSDDPIFLIDFQTVLPVELSEFGVQKRSCDNFALNWITQSEINNDFFSIERSVDNIYSFETVAKVDGAGDSNTARTYSYEDEVRLKGKHTVYYRLKQTDFDGKSSYSNIILTKLDCDSGGRLSIYPNPFDSVINIDKDESEGSRTIVINAQGQLVHDSSLTSSNSSTISTSDWPNGLYIARNLVNGEVVDSQKIIKQN